MRLPCTRMRSISSTQLLNRDKGFTPSVSAYKDNISVMNAPIKVTIKKHIPLNKLLSRMYTNVSIFMQQDHSTTQLSSTISNKFLLIVSVAPLIYLISLPMTAFFPL